jgi:RES domain-containing protein
MSEDFATAVAEYEQDLGIRPGTLCAYEVGASGVVDLTDESARRPLGIDLSQLRISWKHVLLVERKRPSTWDLAERLISAGATGMLVRSVRGPGRNLVLWRWNEASGPVVRVLDPFGELSTPRRGRRSR